MKEPCPINIFEIKINTKILSALISDFIVTFNYNPYIIMNETTLNEMEKYYIVDCYGAIIKYDNIKSKEKTIPKFKGCTILIDNSLNNGEVLLR